MKRNRFLILWLIFLMFAMDGERKLGTKDESRSQADSGTRNLEPLLLSPNVWSSMKLESGTGDESPTQVI